MWKLLVSVAVIMTLAEAQRSSYAPRPGSYSKLLPRFRNNNATTTTTTTDRSLNSRGGEEEASTSTLPQNLQGTLEDEKFVQRVSRWPEEKQPFWFKNRVAIQSMRGREIDGGSVDGTLTRSSSFNEAAPSFQSPFFGPSNIRSRSSASLARLRPNDNFFNQNEY